VRLGFGVAVLVAAGRGGSSEKSQRRKAVKLCIQRVGAVEQQLRYPMHGHSLAHHSDRGFYERYGSNRRLRFRVAGRNWP
jgi:hypothetical protein